MLDRAPNLTLNQGFYKKFRMFQNIQVNFFFFKQQKILTFKNNSSSYYFILPCFFNLFFKQNYMHLTCAVSVQYKLLYNFLMRLNVCAKQLSRVSAVTFLIRGVGLKISLTEAYSSVLSLKFGYSHLIFLPVPAVITTTALFKKRIILCAFNKMLLGNFAYLLYKYKPINIFTGKGLLKKQKKKIKLKEYTKKI